MKIGLIIIIFVLIIAIISLICALFSILNKPEPREVTRWVLHSYGNNIALYKGDDIIEVFGAVALDTLPREDRQRLDNGIVFNTREEALSAIEDYDG